MYSLILYANVGTVPVSDPSLLWWYISACKPFFALLFMFISITFVTLAIMNWLAISRNAIVPADMIEQFHEKWETKKYQEAYEIAKNSDSVLGKMLAIGLTRISEKAVVTAEVEQAMMDTAEEEVMVLEHRLGYLGSIAVVSPMVGLLGTVWGMVDTFSVISRTGGAANASELAEGVSLALVTTQIGLLIAIPALVLFEIFKPRLARLVLQLDAQTKNVLTMLK